VSANAPAPRRPLPEDVADRIVAWLRQEGLGTDAVLPSERTLAERLGVGRSTVREALQRLRRMGMVDVRQGGRGRVARPTASALVEQIAAPARLILHSEPGSLADLKEARLLLEVAVVRLACERATTEDLLRLRACQDELIACAAAAGGDFDAFLAADMTFHQALGQATGNAVLAGVSLAATNFLMEFHTGLVRLSGAEEITIAEHAAILEAVEMREAGEAERRMRAHLLRASDLYRALERGG